MRTKPIWIAVLLLVVTFLVGVSTDWYHKKLAAVEDLPRGLNIWFPPDPALVSSSYLYDEFVKDWPTLVSRRITITDPCEAHVWVTITDPFSPIGFSTTRECEMVLRKLGFSSRQWLKSHFQEVLHTVYPR